LTTLVHKTLEDYLALLEGEKTPLFNLPLFYQNLESKVEPDKVPFFNLSREQEKRFEGKIPDPNETLTDFFKRVGRFEIQKPPLVDRDSVPHLKRGSTYMKLQSKLLEIEYRGAKVNLNDDKPIKENDIEMNIVSLRENKEEEKHEIQDKKADETNSLRNLKEEESNKDRQEKKDIKIETFTENKPQEKYNEYISSSFASEDGEKHKYVEEKEQEEEKPKPLDKL